MPYVKDRRVRTRRALYKGGRGIAGLGDACTDFGPGYVTQPNGDCEFVISGSGNTTGGTVYTSTVTGTGPAPTQSNGGWEDVLAAGAGAIGKIFGSQPQPVVMAPSSGIDTTTLLVIGGLGLGAVLLLSRRGS